MGAVERVVLDGFAEVFGRESRSAFQIGDGARNFQDAVMGARGNAEDAKMSGSRGTVVGPV